MGYTTEFIGTVHTDKPVTDEFRDYINHFAYVRHMRRDNNRIKEVFPDWQEKCFNGELGEEGEYFANYDDLNFGQTEDVSVVDGNRPATSQPGLWCQWIMSDNSTLEWDGSEKFYHYTEWLRYLITRFFAPEGYVLNGTVQWSGEDINDNGVIKVVNNEITARYI